MTALLKTSPAPDTVLAKAVLRAGEQLGLRQVQLAAVLGMHRTAVSRLKTSQSLDPASKQGEIALLLIRVARALFALTGGDIEWIRHFMRSPNTITGGIPAEQICTLQGLMTVLRVVDALRGRI